MGWTFLALALAFTLMSHWFYGEKVEGYLLKGAAVAGMMGLVCFIVGA